MLDPILPIELVTSSEGPFVAAVELTQRTERTTARHSHARGQLVGASSGLVSIGLDDEDWVVPAVHAVWIPPHRVHSLRSFGPFAGWSVFVAEDRCAALPGAPRAIVMSTLLREAVRRAASWRGAGLDAARADRERDTRRNRRRADGAARAAPPARSAPQADRRRARGQSRR
ncbi:araC family regulatory protein [Burkholderia pseudomallei]|nr:araC family regulatory protein [Burkholderia pseudomallei]